MAENIYKERIEKYIDEHREDMLEDIKRLVRINSEKGEEKSGMPFGEGPYKALCEAEDIMRGYGFKVTNYDNYVTTADISDKERCLDILAHLDVVPAGEGWQITTPYEPVVKNGRIYGRGTADDKGPFIAALYAMRAIKELNIPISKNVRLIGGTDEECGSSDIAYYYKKEQEAPMTFSPDGEFPVVNIEKGSLRGHFYADYTVDTDKKIVDFTAGTKVNVVPGKAYATVSGISIQEIEQAAKAAAKVTFVDYICEEKDNGVYITAVGKGAHASTPKEGNNAITALLFLLTTLPFEDNEQIRLVKRLYAMMPHNDSNGIALNVAMSDELSGELTLAFSLLTIREGRIDGTFDSRCPICANEDNVLKVIKDRIILLLKHLKPKKIYANMIIGTGDPCNTGLLFGGISILMGLWPGDYTFVPDFDNKVIEGKAYCKGRIRVSVLLYHVIKLLLDDTVKKAWKHTSKGIRRKAGNGGNR